MDGPPDTTELQRRAGQLAELLTVVAPAVEADGGELRLVDADYAAGIVTVELAGSCSACAVASVTLEAGLERILRQRLDWLVELRSGVEASDDLAADTARGRGGFVART